MKPGSVASFFKEPFVQFLLIGAGIFAATYLFAPPTPEQRDHRIVITAPMVEAMRAKIEKYSGKGIPKEELRARLQKEIDAKIHMEILYREGVARGLGKDDSVVKKRIASLMERAAREQASTQPFTDREIEAYYNSHPDEFTLPARISFGQVLFSARKRGREKAREDCMAVLARIQSGELTDFQGLEKLGDPEKVVRNTYRNITLERARAIFGDAFVRDISGQTKPGVIAPVESSYGYHIVMLQDYVPAKRQPLDKVKERIRRRLEEKRKAAAFAAFYDQVKDEYKVTVEEPK